MIEKKIFKIIGVSLLSAGLYLGLSPLAFSINRDRKIENLQTKPEIINYIKPAEETLREMNRSIHNLYDNYICYGDGVAIGIPPSENEIDKARSHLEKAIEIFDFPELSGEESIVQEMNYINNSLIYQKKNWEYEIDLIKKQKKEIKDYFNKKLPEGIVIKEPTKIYDYLFNAYLGTLGLISLSIGFSKDD
jgi:hypothetical protein